jgi:hypothetical protein
MAEIKKIKLKDFQDRFVFSKKRYVSMIAGVGTGKSMCLLLKVWRHCEENPGALALVCRRNFTDLRDSTIQDFIRYFGVKPNSDKEYRFANDSVILFRHGDEMDTLKNLNLSLWAIEQAEEFPDDSAFQMLRDRLRRDNVDLRQGILISNAAGKNWIYDKWVANPPSDEYDLITATTFDNEDNLPPDFVKDLKAMKEESPHHYARYVMNDFSELESDDMLLTGEMVYGSPKLSFAQSGYPTKILGVDVARFGDDSTVFSLIQARDRIRWEQVYQEAWKNRDTMQVVGKIIDLIQHWGIDHVVIDEIGLGGGVIDRLGEQKKCEVYAFNAAKKSSQPDQYANQKAEAYFKLREMFALGHLKIIDDRKLHEELLSTRFLYKSNGARAIVGKDEMRKDGKGSPDRAEALTLACYFKDIIVENEDNVMQGHDFRHPAYSTDKWDPFDQGKDKWKPW